MGMGRGAFSVVVVSSEGRSGYHTATLCSRFHVPRPRSPLSGRYLTVVVAVAALSSSLVLAADRATAALRADTMSAHAGRSQLSAETREGGKENFLTMMLLTDANVVAVVVVVVVVHKQR